MQEEKMGKKMTNPRRTACVFLCKSTGVGPILRSNGIFVPEAPQSVFCGAAAAKAAGQIPDLRSNRSGAPAAAAAVFADLKRFT